MTITEMIIIALIYALAYCTCVSVLSEIPFAFSFTGGLLCGAVLGDWKTGLMIGAGIQTLNMAVVTTGATINYDIVNIGLHFFSRMFDLMLPPVAKHSIVVA